MLSKHVKYSGYIIHPVLIKYVNNGKIISMNNVALDDESMKIERETVKKNPRIAEIERIKNFSNLSNKFCILKN